MDDTGMQLIISRQNVFAEGNEIAHVENQRQFGHILQVPTQAIDVRNRRLAVVEILNRDGDPFDPPLLARISQTVTHANRGLGLPQKIRKGLEMMHKRRH